MREFQKLVIQKQVQVAVVGHVSSQENQKPISRSAIILCPIREHGSLVQKFSLRFSPRLSDKSCHEVFFRCRTLSIADPMLHSRLANVPGQWDSEPGDDLLGKPDVPIPVTKINFL